MGVKKGQSWDKAMIHLDSVISDIEKNVLGSPSYLLPLASKTSFIDWYAQYNEHQLSSVCLIVPF
jgi:hypothetical protein